MLTLLLFYFSQIIFMLSGLVQRSFHTRGTAGLPLLPRLRAISSNSSGPPHLNLDQVGVNLPVPPLHLKLVAVHPAHLDSRSPQPASLHPRSLGQKKKVNFLLIAQLHSYNILYYAYIRFVPEILYI